MKWSSPTGGRLFGPWFRWPGQGVGPAPAPVTANVRRRSRSDNESFDPSGALDEQMSGRDRVPRTCWATASTSLLCLGTSRSDQADSPAMSTTFWLCSKGHENHPTRDRCGVCREKRVGGALPIPAGSSAPPWYRTKEKVGVAALVLAALLVIGAALWSEFGPTSPRARRDAASTATQPARQPAASTVDASVLVQPTAPSTASGSALPDDEILYDPASLGRLGDCFDEGIDAYVARGCDESHDYELVLVDASYDAALDEPYPSDEDWSSWEAEHCIPALEERSATTYSPDILDVIAIGPTQDTWVQGDRSFWCAAYSPNGKLTAPIQE